MGRLHVFPWHAWIYLHFPPSAVFGVPPASPPQAHMAVAPPHSWKEPAFLPEEGGRVCSGREGEAGAAVRARWP